jgi:hypothetical protein
MFEFPERTTIMTISGGLAGQREETTDEPQGWTREGTQEKSQTQSQWVFSIIDAVSGLHRHPGSAKEFIFI